ncbi:hypothetical protein QE357_003514 [Siphonobacter sp. BAB-5404]|nr:hypothetical protein [Siphonobacter sp. SORGH_AS_0500]
MVVRLCIAASVAQPTWSGHATAASFIAGINQLKVAKRTGSELVDLSGSTIFVKRSTIPILPQNTFPSDD